MSTMPGRRLERVAGSNNNPVTTPPSGLLKEMALTSTPLVVDSTAFCRFSGALTSYANRSRSAAVATPPKSGRATAQESASRLGSADDPEHAAMKKASSAVVGFIDISKEGPWRVGVGVGSGEGGGGSKAASAKSLPTPTPHPHSSEDPRHPIRSPRY